MELILNLLMGIIGFGMNIIFFFIKLIIAFIVGGIAAYKRRSGLFYGVIAFFFPWFIFIMPFIPRRMPKLNAMLRTNPAFSGRSPVIASIMALAASVAKADGNVTKEEITLIKDFLMTQFNLSREELNKYAEAFEYGKSHPDEYMYFTAVVREYYLNRQMFTALIYLFLKIAKDGDTISQAAEVQVRRIAQELGVSEYEYQGLRQMALGGGFGYGYGSQGQSYQYGQYGGYEGYNGAGGYNTDPQALLKKYSEVLGVSEDATMAEIKKAYRKLAKEYHPDKFSAEGMPEEYVTFANQKISEINEAYEYLKKLKEA